MSRRDAYHSDPRLEIITGACPHDCPDTCAWQVAVERETGRATDIWGHPDHPVTGGKLCGKVDRYLERTYHSDRLTTPMRRVGAKGEGRFEAIGWDEAIEMASRELASVVATHGAESVLQYSYGGTLGLLQGEGMAQRFFNRMGASRLARTICAEAGAAGLEYTLGAKVGMDMADFEHAQLILLWGTNTLTSNLHLWPFVQKARSRGAKVVVIDPVRTRTARAADQWIPIRPGTDAALGLAIMHVLVAEDLVDRDYIERGTVGFAELEERVVDWSPARAEAITGIPSHTICELARAYGRASPAAIRINYGLQRHRGGGMAVRTLSCLPALVGAWRHRGGGIQLSTSGWYALDRGGLERPDLLGDRSPRTMNMNRLGDALCRDPQSLIRAHARPRPIDPEPATPGPAVHGLVVYNCNPAAVVPEQQKVLEGLGREDLFTIVLEQFQTDTADYADLLLPATTQLEHWDLVKSYGHLHLALNRPAIRPLGESLPNSEIFRRLAIGLGYDDDCFREGDEEILRRLVDAQTNAAMRSVTWSRLLSEGFCRLDLPEPFLPFADGHFPTPSGKCELVSPRMADDGYDPLPTFHAPDVAGGGDHELCCISPPAHSFLNSTFVNVDKFAARERGPSLSIHPDDARACAVEDGNRVVVHNARGEVELRAKVTEDVVRGTVVAPSIWWNKLSENGRNINWLVPAHETDMGAGACFYDVLVRVRAATNVD